MQTNIWKPFVTTVFVLIVLEVLVIFLSTDLHSNNFNLRTNNINPVAPGAIEQIFDASNSLIRRLGTVDDDSQFQGTYSPSDFVTYGHKFTGMKFAVTTAYGQRLLYAPIITFGLGFLALFSTCIGYLCRCCVDACRCLPDKENIHYDRDRLCMTIFYFVLCILILVIDQLVFLGNESVDTGIKLMKSDVDTLNNNYLTTINNDATQLYNYGTNLNAEYSAAQTSCPVINLPPYSTYTNIPQDITTFQSEMTSITSDINQVSDKINLFDHYIDLYGIFYRNIALYIIWGLAIGTVLFFLVSKCCESVTFTKFSIGFGSVTYLLFILLGVPWLLIVSGGGDLCMSPTSSIIHAIPIDTVKNITSYYATCKGQSFINIYINEGVASLDTLNQSVNALLSPLSPCSGNNDIEAMQFTISQMYKSIDNINASVACPPINALYEEVVNKGLCDDLYQGIFYIWGSQLITSFLLFVLIVISSILYQYYEGSDNRIVPQDDEKDDDVDVEEEELGKGKVVKADLVKL